MLLLLAGVLALRPQAAAAQQRPAGMLVQQAPVTLGARYDYAADGSVLHQVIGEAGLSFPLGAFLPQLSAQSQVSLLRLAAGARFGKNATTRLRGRAGLLDMDVYRAPVAVGLTLLDYNRSGLPKVDARWLAFRLGPSLRLGSDGLSLEPRLVGVASLSTLKLGRAVYSALGEPAGEAAFGFEVGYRAEVTLDLGAALMLGGFYEQQSYFADPGPRLTSLGVEGQFRLSERLQVFGRYTREEARVDEQGQTFDAVRGGLRLRLRRR